MKEIAFKYFAGEISPESAKRLREFLSGGSANYEQFRLWEDEWKKNHIPTIHQVVSFKRLSRRIATRKVFRIGAGFTAFAFAAAAILLAVFKLPTVNSFEQVAPDVPNLTVSVETRSCEQTKVVLPDSTVVWLNASSRLNYSQNYKNGDRTVYLEGEGFFDVRHDESCPFVVKMGSNEIRVYGTRFNACAYPDEDVVEAALLEGSIAFSNNSVMVQMQPGEILSYNHTNEKLVKYSGDVLSRTSWIDGTIVYSSTDIASLLKRISSVYGEKIVFKSNGKPTNTFAIILNIKETIPNILDAVNLICPVKWTTGENGEYIVETI